MQLQYSAVQCSAVQLQYLYINISPTYRYLVPYVMYFYHETNMKYVSYRLREINDFDFDLIFAPPPPHNPLRLKLLRLKQAFHQPLDAYPAPHRPSLPHPSLSDL
jgi:hypothetical protein